MAQTRFLGWTVDKESDATTYRAAVNEWWQTRYREAFAANWYPRLDTLGRWIVPYLGPPAIGPDGEVEEPPEMVALRAAAAFVEASSIEWPDAEE
ncbi:MAG: hypothetical protein KIS73_27970 [Enhydrobacter sp.]|nr:hypothetical protein [Enhydrobacter sp.]